MNNDKVFSGEDKCALTLDQVNYMARRYFSWDETYQNPLSEAYRRGERIDIARLILLNAAQKDNFSFYTIAKNNSALSPDTIRQVFTTDADFVLDETYTPEALSQAEFTPPYGYDFYTFCITFPHGTPNTDGFWDVFSWEVWLSLALVCLLSSAVLHWLSISFQEGRFTVSWRDSYSFIVKNLILEGHGIQQPSVTVQVFAAAWIFVAFIVTSIYLSVVVSCLLSVKPPTNIPETFEDLVTYGYDVKTPERSQKEVYYLLQSSKSPSLEYLSRAITTAEWPKLCMDDVLEGPHVACIEKYREMRVFAETTFLNDDKEPMLQVSRRRGSIIWIAFAFRKEMQLGHNITKFLKIAGAAGLLQRWEEEGDHPWFRWGHVQARLGKCANEEEIWGMWTAARARDTENDKTGASHCYYFHFDMLETMAKENCTRREDDASSKALRSSNDPYLNMAHLMKIFEICGVFHWVAICVFAVEIFVGRKSCRRRHLERNEVLMVVP